MYRNEFVSFMTIFTKALKGLRRQAILQAQSFKTSENDKYLKKIAVAKISLIR